MLLTDKASRSPGLIGQIDKELASAKWIDWLVPIIKWRGLRPLRDAHKSFTDIENDDGSRRIRVLTTSCFGATDPKAVEFLPEPPNTGVRASCDTFRTRLHATAPLMPKAARISPHCCVKTGHSGEQCVASGSAGQDFRGTSRLARGILLNPPAGFT